MTQPAQTPHDEDGIEYGHVFAAFTEGTADSSVDLDPYPDERWLTGTVTFRPSFSGQAASAALRVPGIPRSRGLVITSIKYDIVASRLVDRQDREGVWLVTAVDGVAVYWEATVNLVDAQKRPVLTRPYLLGPDVFSVAEDGTRTVNLPDLMPTPSALPPAGTEAVLAAQLSAKLAERSAAAAAETARLAGEAHTGAQNAEGEAEDHAASARESNESATGSAWQAAQSASDADTARQGSEAARDSAAGSADAAGESESNAAGSEAAAREHASEAGVQRWASVDERWAAVDARNLAIGAKDDAIIARDESRTARDEAEGFRTQAGVHAATATEKATEAGGSAALAADFTATSRILRDQSQEARDIAVANGLTWRGTWAPGTAYAAQDVVTDAGASWRALAASTGVQPAEGGSWSLLAARGAPGTNGATEITWGDVLDKPTVFAPGAHTHGPEDLGSGGVRTGSSFLNGLGNWVVPYSVIPQAEAETGTAVTARLLSAARLREAILHRVTGAAETAVSAIGQALARAATAAEARTAIGAASATHTHTAADLGAVPASEVSLSATADTVARRNASGRLLAGDVGNWASYELVNGRSAEGRYAQSGHTHARMDTAPATWLWAGTALPTAATQVHAQARLGDFIVAPNLTTSPGWHQITGV